MYLLQLFLCVPQRCARTDANEERVFTEETTALEFRCALFRNGSSNSSYFFMKKWKKKRSLGRLRKTDKESNPRSSLSSLLISPFPTYFYIYTTKYTRVRPMFVDSIAIDAFRTLCTRPTPGHVATEDSFDLFLVQLWCSSLLDSVPPGHAMITSSIVLHTLRLNFRHFPVSTRRDESTRRCT